MGVFWSLVSAKPLDCNSVVCWLRDLTSPDMMYIRQKKLGMNLWYITVGGNDGHYTYVMDYIPP